MELRIQFANLLRLPVALMVINLSWQHASAASRNQNATDQFALLAIKRQISDDPQEVFNTWNHSVHHCQWQGVTCDARHRRVTTLTLRGKGLFGSISPHIGNLSFLKSIELQENRLFGEIPWEIGKLFRLRHLNLSVNTLSGRIPANLSYCSELVNISARNNGFTGQIPEELGSLKKLAILNFAINNLTGYIPSSMGNLSSLNIFALGRNNLEGSVPSELGMLINLFLFSISENLLTGTFPPALFNISTLKTVSITDNFLHGYLPSDIGLKLPNLKEFDTGRSYFTGVIPDSIANATKLKKLCFSSNKFQGQVPTNLGNLAYIRHLNIEDNLFGENSVQDLNFISSLTNCSRLQVLAFGYNNFGGALPKTIGNLSSQLRLLYMGANKISGAIPLELANLVNLYELEMGSNSFSGTIPRNFGEFQYLQVLNLAATKLSGLIPSTIYNITSLYFLDLQKNHFEGTIPPTLGNCRNLKTLDLSQNKLTGALSSKIFGQSFSPSVLDLSHNSLAGSLPVEVGNLKNLYAFNVSYNNLSGEIPRTLGGSSSLEYLNMEGNSFQGSIPSTLASLKGMQRLDLSQNQLTGQIPRDLERLSFLKYLNLSFNDLQGEIPSNGVFGDASLISLVGNTKLCGGVAGLELHSCLVQRKNNKKIPVIIAVAMLLTVILISAIFFLLYQRRVRRKRLSTMPSGDEKFIKVSFHELHRATAGFSPQNLIGSGSFGFVYKARLDKHGDRIVAVKVLDLQKNGASKSFKAECRALRNIRHRNLVTTVTYCSSIDRKGQEFKALVYEFMENGSLDSWLHPELAETERSRKLNIVRRLNIAIDVASALHYLHNHTEVPVVHCDIKPSNILLDNDLTAHVGDFGLARLLLQTTDNSSEQGISSSSVAIKGSIGYAAPEYGMGVKASTEGDVYGYGIFLLEMFTGRRPTDDTFVDGLDLHKFVKINFPEQVMKITDPSLSEENRNSDRHNVQIAVEDNGEEMQKCLVSIFNVGLKCSATLPEERMNTNELMKELLRIKDAFFAARRHRAICYRV